MVVEVDEGVLLEEGVVVEMELAACCWRYNRASAEEAGTVRSSARVWPANS